VAGPGRFREQVCAGGIRRLERLSSDQFDFLRSDRTLPHQVAEPNSVVLRIFT
jgi:hypothetical protein